MNTHVIVFVCSVPSDQCCVACSHPVCHDCSHKTLCTRCVFIVDDKNSCSNASSSHVESDCVSAEANIVEEEQNMWRRIKKGTKFQVDAGRRSALLLSSQQVKAPHVVAESLITSTVKDALSRTPRVTGGSAAAVREALQLRCDVCESQQHPGPHLPARLRTDREFGDTAAIDLFVLADF